MDREERKKTVSNWIQARRERNQDPMPCIFQITIPKFLIDERLEDNENIKVLTDIFDKYGIDWQSVNTIGGAFNLNRDCGIQKKVNIFQIINNGGNDYGTRQRNPLFILYLCRTVF